MAEDSRTVDRRQFRRVHVPIVFSPMGLGILHHPRRATDVSPGGMRTFSDDRLSLGQRLEVELLLPDLSSIKCWVRVAWVDELGPGRPARFDIGFQFLDLDQAEADRLTAALDEP
ncbi:MAG TPA: PilZ domain-containing protein [Candidatus Dormibacteraeota bacterium]|jgi:hypothetical protein|nr:PilZ domain-containing protein [Candidatus Dormibacteraeota bacterium]